MGEDIGTRRAYEEIFLDVGTFYLLAGILDNAGLCEHGISIREPWLTNAGKSLLDGLKTISPIAIDEATGTGYDGIEYD